MLARAPSSFHNITKATTPIADFRDGATTSVQYLFIILNCRNRLTTKRQHFSQNVTLVHRALSEIAPHITHEGKLDSASASQSPHERIDIMDSGNRMRVPRAQPQTLITIVSVGIIAIVFNSGNFIAKGQ